MNGSVKLSAIRFTEPQGAHIAGQTRYIVTTGDGSAALKVDSIEVLPSGGSVLIRHGNKLYWVPATLCGSGDALLEQNEPEESAEAEPARRGGRRPKANSGQ